MIWQENDVEEVQVHVNQWKFTGFSGARILLGITSLGMY